MQKRSAIRTFSALEADPRLRGDPPLTIHVSLTTGQSAGDCPSTVRLLSRLLTHLTTVITTTTTTTETERGLYDEHALIHELSAWPAEVSLPLHKLPDVCDRGMKEANDAGRQILVKVIR